MSRTLDLTYADAIAPTDSLTAINRGDGVFMEVVEGGVAKTAVLSREDTEHLTRALAEYLGLETERHAPKVFKENAALGEVRKGDLIRTEYTLGGVKRAREGVADGRPGHDWETADGVYLYAGDAIANGGTITILDRPEPEPPVSPSLDRNGNAWWGDGDGVWWSITDPHQAPQTTEELIEQYGPLRPARIVEADQ